MFLQGISGGEGQLRAAWDQEPHGAGGQWVEPPRARHCGVWGVSSSAGPSESGSPRVWRRGEPALVPRGRGPGGAGPQLCRTDASWRDTLRATRCRCPRALMCDVTARRMSLVVLGPAGLGLGLGGG